MPNNPNTVQQIGRRFNFRFIVTASTLGSSDSIHANHFNQLRKLARTTFCQLADEVPGGVQCFKLLS